MENVSFNTDKMLSDLTGLLDSGKITYEQFSEKYDSIVNTAKEIYAKNEETKQLEIKEKAKVDISKNEIGKEISNLISSMKPQRPNWRPNWTVSDDPSDPKPHQQIWSPSEHHNPENPIDPSNLDQQQPIFDLESTFGRSKLN